MEYIGLQDNFKMEVIFQILIRLFRFCCDHFKTLKVNGQDDREIIILSRWHHTTEETRCAINYKRKL